MDLPSIIISTGLSLFNHQRAKLATAQSTFEKEEFHFETLHDQEEIRLKDRGQYNISGSFGASLNGYYHNVPYIGYNF